MSYLFRKEFDEVYMKFGSISHIIFIIITLLGLYIVKKEKNSIFLKINSFILFFLQLLYSFFYLINGFNYLELGLPLYTCRIVMFVMIIYPYKKLDILKCIAVYMGVMGGIIALIYPMPDSYSFPHITNFIFIFGHAIILWNGYYIIKNENFRFEKESFLKYLKFLNFCLAFILSINILLKTNYSFLNESPISLKLKFYPIVAIIVYNLISLIIYLIGKRYEKVTNI